MRITIIAVGRRKKGPEQDLFDQYKARLPWPLDLKLVEEKKPLSGDALKAREAELLLAACPDGATLVALDERGTSDTSPKFAERLGAWRDGGVRDLVFLIGGADGLAADLRKRADFVMSLGAQTWPHQLVPALLAEQLYRGHAILTGHPYHRV
ncbi:23S rRNA (pseudouridine(1915)-N(3))-methyltransferase RlmH [Thalassospiraceae bacterium LMO-SO8]|nr:23S rRNA (pseudouridine(1915)-N(3))-methyltransferase RlmH [Alphaproteobacteria bacterium LMO-S08]WND76650.1 23S rRNA (pseudouridine(1915)-N(3))-methyltransferase RlmH [Thalassospiraceae bacterium LMO-SO8]